MPIHEKMYVCIIQLHLNKIINFLLQKPVHLKACQTASLHFKHNEMIYQYKAAILAQNAFYTIWLSNKGSI